MRKIFFLFTVLILISVFFYTPITPSIALPKDSDGNILDRNPDRLDRLTRLQEGRNRIAEEKQKAKEKKEADDLEKKQIASSEAEKKKLQEFEQSYTIEQLKNMFIGKNYMGLPFMFENEDKDVLELFQIEMEFMNELRSENPDIKRLVILYEESMRMRIKLTDKAFEEFLTRLEKKLEQKKK